MQIDTIKMPAFWASYLINGDASGISAEEKKLADDYLQKSDIREIVNCADEAHFSWFFDFYGGDTPGGDLLEYDVIYWGEHEDALPL